MIKEFYEKVLPSSGVYCVADIDPATKRTRHKFVESIGDLVSAIESRNQTKTNIFVALSSFNGYSRKADEAKFVKSFYIDLDVGENKEYASKEEALEALNKFVNECELPPPVRIDSGGGVHAYWIFDRDIPADEWKPYAEKFKDFCMEKGLKIDPVVTADLARILRCPDTFNYKSDPPSPTKLIDETLPVYVFDEFKEFLGSVEPSIMDILNSVQKGLTEDELKYHRRDNFTSNFGKLLEKSIQGTGCNQIKHLYENAKDASYALWTAGLTVASKCEDKDTAIHIISEGHEGYNREATIAKANDFTSVHSCKKFEEANPGGCQGCPKRGIYTNPLPFGSTFKEGVQPSQTQQNIAPPINRPQLPIEIREYRFGPSSSGVYQIRPPKVDKAGIVHQEDPVMLCRYDLYATKRIYSTTDGECLLMKTDLPNDAPREFLLPMKSVYAQEEFKKILSSNGVLFKINSVAALADYIIQWGSYLMDKHAAEIMRMQMGWTPNRESFVIGDKEILRNGTTVNSPTSPLCRAIAKHLVPTGSYDVWKEAANKLNQESLEFHAFTLLAGFGSPLMEFTSTSGITLTLTGKSGAAKTGALYSALSVWGNPKDLSVLEATDNGITGRFLSIHSMPFGFDEVGNIEGKLLSKLLHKISQGKSKIRMQASVNAERESELSASLIGIFTSNQSLYDKLSGFKKDANGEVARLVEIMVRQPKVFDDNPLLGKEIFDKFRFNYGWAGHDFIKAIYTMGDDEINRIMDNWSLKFKKDFGDDTSYRFYENLVVACMTAGVIVNAAGIVSFDLDRIYARIVRELIAIRDGVVKINAVNYESLIGEFLANNQTGILSIKNSSSVMEPRTALIARIEEDTQLLYIVRSAFRKFLLESQISSREFLFQMGQMGIDVIEKKKKLAVGWKGALEDYNLDAYVFNVKTFPDNILKGIPTETT